MNKLINEVSTYLLQHKDNPVHWEAWNDESLERSMVEDKPIIISIGYAACHWCHVMEHESFEDQEVADLMNTHFINIICVLKAVFGLTGFSNSINFTLISLLLIKLYV